MCCPAEKPSPTFISANNAFALLPDEILFPGKLQIIGKPFQIFEIAILFFLYHFRIVGHEKVRAHDKGDASRKAKEHHRAPETGITGFH